MTVRDGASFRDGLLDADEFLLDAAGDPGFAGGGEHVDLAADAELGEVDAGLDGEAGVGQKLAHVVGLEVVKVRAGAVNLVGDVVAGAVGEELGKAGRADDGAGGVVGLEAADGAVLGEGLLDGVDGGVAGVADGLKDKLLLGRGLAADDGGPGDVVVDAGGSGESAPRCR